MVWKGWRGWKGVVVGIAGMVLSGVSVGQVCVPDVSALQGPGYSPDTFRWAFVLQPYEMVFSFILMRETTIVYNGVPVTVRVDSVHFDTVLGLPAGFQWATDKPDRWYRGGDTGCVRIWGTPQPGQEGIYTAMLVGTGYGTIQGLGLPVVQTDSVARPLYVCPDTPTCRQWAGLDTTIGTGIALFSWLSSDEGHWQIQWQAGRFIRLRKVSPSGSTEKVFGYFLDMQGRILHVFSFVGEESDWLRVPRHAVFLWIQENRMPGEDRRGYGFRLR